MSWSIDGMSWDIPCTIERTAEMTSSEISGMLMNKQYFNDVLGTWMRYTVSLAIPKGREADYESLYEILTAPVDGHACSFPYNQSTINITARIEVVSDKYVKLPRDRQTWRAIKFECIANHPSKELELDEVISKGMTPLPEAPSAQNGDLYEKTNYGWVQRFYDDGDEIYY